MNSITFYNRLNGKIIGQLTATDSSLQITKESPFHAWVDDLWFAQTHYIPSGEVTLRPENPATLTGLELTNLPVPCVVKIGTQSYPCTESTATLSFNQPGTYKVTIESWPHLDKEFSVDYPA
jgi:hypothetical protein